MGLKVYKRLISAAVIVSCLLVLCSCGNTSEKRSYRMGAAVTQTVYGGKSGTAKLADEAIARLDAEISYRVAGSAVAALNETGSAGFSDTALSILGKCLEVYSKTDGVFDITLLPVVLTWGFDKEAADYRVPDPAELYNVLNTVGSSRLEINGNTVCSKGADIDLSAAGKGAACDEACRIYRENGVSGAIVSVGGSLGVYGTKNGKPFTVAVRDPFGTPNDMLGTLEVTDIYISTSGSYEKTFTADGATYHHLLDANTGYPVDNGLVSVTVLCGNGALSDILSSAVFCVGIREGAALAAEYGAEVIFVTAEKKVYITPGLEGKLDTEYECDVIIS